MGWQRSKAFLWFFLPGGLLLAMGLTLVLVARLSPLVPKITAVAPYLVLATGTLLGWRFNRGRLAYGVLAFFLVDRFLLAFPVAGARLGSPGWTVLNSVVLLLPLNLALIFLLRERGLATVRGMWRLLFITLQPAMVFSVYKWKKIYLDQLFSFQLFPFLPQSLPLSHAALLAFALVLLLFLGVAVKRRGVVDYGFFWALIAGFLALLPWQTKQNATLFFAIAGLILLIATLEEAYKMAFRDELTGLPARRALNEDLLKLPTRYTVAMADIDFFKKFNDQYGHEVGDQVLRMVAAKLATVSGGGKAYRYGGEEFTLLFPGVDLDEALPHLEQIRARVETAEFTVRDPGRPKSRPKKKGTVAKARKKVSITISIGAAEPEERQAKPHRVIKAADKALYLAKKRGRNQVAS